MGDKLIRVVIVSYNTCELLRNCLSLLYASTVVDKLTFTVVDNGSADASVAMVEREYPEVTLVHSSENLGFGRANNIALEGMHEPYALLVNSDTFVQPDTLEKLYRYMESNKDVGIAGPKTLNQDGSVQASCRRFPSMAQAAVHGFLHKIAPRNRFSRAYRMEDMDHEATLDVDWVSGLCMMIRAQTAKALGGFDPEYFFYVEDVDLCKRAHMDGWRVVFCGEASVVHLGGASGGYHSPKMISEFHKSMLAYYRKHGKQKWLFPFVWVGVQIRKAVVLWVNQFQRHNSSVN